MSSSFVENTIRLIVICTYYMGFLSCIRYSFLKIPGNVTFFVTIQTFLVLNIKMKVLIIQSYFLLEIWFCRPPLKFCNSQYGKKFMQSISVLLYQIYGINTNWHVFHLINQYVICKNYKKCGCHFNFICLSIVGIIIKSFLIDTQKSSY